MKHYLACSPLWIVLLCVILSNCDTVGASEPITFANSRFGYDSRHVFILAYDQKVLATVFRDEDTERVLDQSRFLDALDDDNRTLNAYADGLLDMAGLAFIGNPPVLSPDFGFEE